MKLLGLIGGTSFHSTLAYYQHINQKVAATLGNAQNPELLLYSINIDIMRRQEEDEIHQKYLQVSQELERAGAEALLICANTPHMAIDFVAPRIGIPFLHIADAVAKKANQMAAQRLLLLGNKPTMTKDFLKGYLGSHHNLDILIPQEADIERSHYFVSNELTQGLFSEEAKTFYINLINTYKDEVDAVILGCTELPLLLDGEQALLPYISTTDLHIQAAVDFILT